MISGHANVELAVEAIRLGAYEFVEKPFSTEKFLNYIKRALESMNLKNEKDLTICSLKKILLLKLPVGVIIFG